MLNAPLLQNTADVVALMLRNKHPVCQAKAKSACHRLAVMLHLLLLLCTRRSVPSCA